MLRIFYFSGTGNARRVAAWVADAWRQRGREAAAFDLARSAPGAVQLGPDDELGLASPTHGFNFPPITLAFLFALPRAGRRNRALTFNTRAGLRLLGLHLPGLAPDAVRDLHRRCEATTRWSAARLLDGRRDLRALWDLPQDLLLAPVALGYFLAGRYPFAKSFVASAFPGLGGLETALLLGALLLAYRLLHRGLGHRAVERVVTLTSLTHFAWWRRYRAPR